MIVQYENPPYHVYYSEPDIDGKRIYKQDPFRTYTAAVEFRNLLRTLPDVKDIIVKQQTSEYYSTMFIEMVIKPAQHINVSCSISPDNTKLI